MRKVVVAVVVLVVVVMTTCYVLYGGGITESVGTLHGTPLPADVVRARTAKQDGPKPILFGDLHVHTTLSTDAFLMSLPLLGGEGTHPPGDACDFARFCSNLDFFALTDHAEALNQRRWQVVKDAVRQCNAVTAKGEVTDLIVFTGFEWTQVGLTPETHHGHKNVIFKQTDEASLPVRPIAAPGVSRIFKNVSGAGVPIQRMAQIPIRDFSRRQRYADLVAFQHESRGHADCPDGVDPKDLPPDCREFADTPDELYGKLDALGHEVMVIPHGSTWGYYTPPGYEYKVPDAEKKSHLVEVYSGHGNSEEYRPWREVVDGACPEPTADHEPCCWRAGELVRSQCGDLPADECERRVVKARADYLSAGPAGQYTVRWAEPEDWMDCGYCRDCFQPAFNYRPGGSVQAMVARGADVGFIASSDNHTARPGTGYKEAKRHGFTEANGPEEKKWRDLLFADLPAPSATTPSLSDADVAALPAMFRYDLERQSAFFLTGGLVGLHAERTREAVWDALQRREVYGTSGPRILLWFDLENGEDGKAPMGSRHTLSETPRFVARAIGAFRQKPGCPDWSVTGFSPERVERVCKGECYNPSDERIPIEKIEVIRIRPQTSSSEDIAPLIEDPWRSFDCTDGARCEISFEDPDFIEGGRTAAYYVRAIQATTDAVNGESIRCERDATGRCTKAKLCDGGYRTAANDDCLSPSKHRAWSSPIYVTPGATP